MLSCITVRSCVCVSVEEGVLWGVYVLTLGKATISIKIRMSWKMTEKVMSHKRDLLILSRSSSEKMRVAGMPVFFLT